MEEYSIYEDMSRRTGGAVYVGVVGPVRTGKSTFIKRFMELLVLPNADAAQKAVMMDELPQASSGRTIMTTEPKFVPATAAEITVGETTRVKVRLVDCVGYVVEGAAGFEEDGEPRYVQTPWSDRPMPFAQAAEIGTKRVIDEHSTLGVLVTTDGSFTSIDRLAYECAEMRTAQELKALGKPFVIVLNCVDAAAAEPLRETLEERYGVPVVAMNVEKMQEEDAAYILKKALFEFPVVRVDIALPTWLCNLPKNNPTVEALLGKVREASVGIEKMKDCDKLYALFSEEDDFFNPVNVDLDAGCGTVSLSLQCKAGLFYRVVSEECGVNIVDDCALMQYVKRLTEDQRNYEKIKTAFMEAEESGYGVVAPKVEDLELLQPKLVKKGANYGVRFRADGASYHVLKIGVSGEIEPIVGGKMQGETFCKELVDSFDTDAELVWETNIFGKTVRELLQETMSVKNDGMPQEIRSKVRRTVGKIVNEGKGSFLCILL